VVLAALAGGVFVATGAATTPSPLAHRAPVKKKFALWADSAGTAVAASLMRRTLRAQEKECDDAAQEFANAQILYMCEVYSVAVIRKHHDELGSFKRQKIFLDDQLAIMTTGWGYSDLALLKHRNNTDPCSVCDSRESDRRLHLLEHVLKVRVRVEERGGKPPAPPHATIFLRALPPVLTAGAPVDPKCNPIFNYNKKVEERAERRVQSCSQGRNRPIPPH
jgi:hypothetical protein